MQDVVKETKNRDASNVPLKLRRKQHKIQTTCPQNTLRLSLSREILLNLMKLAYREVYETESVLNALKIRVDCTLHFPFNQCVKKELEDMKRVSKIYYLTTEHVLCEGT